MKKPIAVVMLAIMLGWGAVNVLVPEVVAQEVDDNVEDDTNTPPEQVPQCYECPCTLIAERGQFEEPSIA